jgi:hypothetical protein
MHHFLGGRNLDSVPASEQAQLLHSPLCYCFSLTSVSDFGYPLLLLLLLLLEEEVRSPWDDDLVHVTYWFLLEVTFALDDDVHVTSVLVGGNICIGR